MTYHTDKATAKRKVWFDSKSYDLAEHFVGSAPELERLRQELAQHIQTSIEDWLEGEQARLDAATGGRG